MLVSKQIMLQTCVWMFYLEILIRKVVTINRFISSAIMMNNVSTLNHETRYYPMKRCSFVMKFYTSGIFAVLPYTVCNNAISMWTKCWLKSQKTMWRKHQLPVHKALKFSANRKFSIIKKLQSSSIVWALLYVNKIISNEVVSSGDLSLDLLKRRESSHRA